MMMSHSFTCYADNHRLKAKNFKSIPEFQITGKEKKYITYFPSRTSGARTPKR